MRSPSLARHSSLLLLTLALVCGSVRGGAPDPATPGTLTAVGQDGNLVELPLRHTDVSVEISAFVARTTVEQVFVNPFDRPIEAVYTFPLGHEAAVDDFELRSGSRVTRGEMHRRLDARQIYETARAAGFQAGLLEQERPNVFTQSVANLLPAGEVVVRLRTVETLDYEAGFYRYVFPLVVGPRYVPGEQFDEPQAAEDAGTATPSSNKRGRPSPPNLPRGVRSGHDVDIRVELDAGVPVHTVRSVSHGIDVQRGRAEVVHVTLAADDRIPNRDFVLRWNVSAEEPATGLLSHRSGVDGYFALIVQPRGVVDIEEAAPKEIVFVLDTSGSMDGHPLRMSKMFVRRALRTLGSRDTFNLIRFADETSVFSGVSLPSSEGAVEEALEWIDDLRSEGGTEMIRGLKRALAHSKDAGRFRMIVFLTDGYIGNDGPMLARVRQLPDDVRVFTVGIGSSVNHSLLDGMARVGGGAYTFVPNDGDAETALGRFTDWVTRPYLTDLEVDWGALPVGDWTPEIPRDLFSGENLTVTGRYFGGAEGTIVVRGWVGGSHWEQEMPVVLPDFEEKHAALGSVWARARIQALLDEHRGAVPDDVREEVTELALEHRLMSPYTSFVAVDYHEVVNPGGECATVDQPVPLPDGTTSGRPADAVSRAVSSGLAIQVVDAAGLPLPAATVTLAHDGGAVATRAELTDRDGTATFPALPPGAGYSVQVVFPGFRPVRVDGLEVEPGTGVLVPIQLFEAAHERVRCYAESATIDLDRHEASTRFHDEFISDLPVPGRFYQNVLTMAPGVQDADGDGNPNVHGSRLRDFETVVGNVSNVDPLSGRWMSRINTNSIEEMEVITAGAGVEFGRAQGGFARIIQKQGSNTHEGVFEAQLGGQALDEAGSREVPASYGAYRGEFQLSGPLVKDRLWYRVSHEWIDQEEPVRTLRDLVVAPVSGSNHSDSLTWQVSPRNKLTFDARWHSTEAGRVGVSSLVRPEATPGIDRDERVFSLDWTAPYSPRMLVETSVARHDFGFRREPSERSAANGCVGDPNTPLGRAECLDLIDGAVTGTLHRVLDDDRRRSSLQSRATIYGGSLWGVTHQFGLGVVFGRERHDRALARNPTLVRGRPEELAGVSGGVARDEQIVLARTGPAGEFRASAESENWALFLEDQIKPSDRVTLTVGGRLDSELVAGVGFSPFEPATELLEFVAGAEGLEGEDRLSFAGSTFTGPADPEAFLDGIRAQVGSDLCCDDPLVPPDRITSPRRPKNVVLDALHVSPYFRIAWSPWANGKTAFSFAFRRYFDGLRPLLVLVEREPATANLLVGGLPGLEESPGFVLPSIQLIDRELEAPYNDEWMIRFEREVFAETALRLTYVRRRYENQLRDHDLNHRFGDYGRCIAAAGADQPSVAPIEDPSDPLFGLYPDGGDGVIDDCTGSWTFDAWTGQLTASPDGLPDLYVQNPLWGDVFLVDSSGSAAYDGITLEIDRSQYRSWQMQVSYTYSRARSDAEEFDPVIGDERTLLDDRAGYASHDCRHVVRMQTTTITPFGIRLGAAAVWQSGLPYSRLTQRIVYDAVPPALEGLVRSTPRPRLVYASEGRNDLRNESSLNVDVRLTKAIDLMKGVEMKVALDILNVFDDRTIQVYSVERGYGRRINGFYDATRAFGRRYQIGVRVTY